MAFSNFDYFGFFLCYNCFRIIQLFIRLVKNLLGRFFQLFDMLFECVKQKRILVTNLTK